MTEYSHSRVNQILIDSLSQDDPPAADLKQCEWEDLWAKARDHCLAPYLHRCWTASGFIDVLPRATASRFSSAREKNTERNRRLLKVLDELRVVLQQKGIPVLISKGLPVAQAYYGDLGLRVLYDLDLLIKSHDRTRAFEILQEIGFVPYRPARGGSKEQTLLWRPREYTWDAERVFDPDQPCFVELHTKPWEPGWHGFQVECNLDLWKGDRVLEVAGIPFRVPLEEKLLVHLAIHYACNVLESNARLMHLLDMARLVQLRGDQLDWDVILNDINESRAASLCFLAFDLVRRACGCQIPRRVWSSLHDATPRGIVDWLGLQGAEDACAMDLHHRERRLIYYLHWHMAAGCSETASVLFHSLRTPWFENAGAERWRSLGRRMIQRLHHLARSHP